MSKKVISLIACMLGLLFTNLHAQYDASPSFYTPYYEEARPYHTRIIERTACDIASTQERQKKYAIIGLNSHSSPTVSYCERYATFGIKDGGAHNIVALSLDEFSWDHSGITKVLFDPRNANVFYVLYQETLRHHDTGELYDPSDIRTYLKRFTYNGTSILDESLRLEVFNYANGADFVIDPNGRILVCVVNDAGYIKGKRIRDMVISGSELTFSDYGEAKVGSNLQGICMDIKGYQVVLGHTTGSMSSPKMRVLRMVFLPFFGGWTVAPTSERFIDNHQMRVDNNTPKTVAIRENGDVFYLNWNYDFGSPSTYDLVKLAEGSVIPTFLFTDSPSAEDLVISEDDNIYVSGVVAGEYAIKLYNQYDAFEHVYDVHADLDNPLHDIAVVDCDILASGHRFTGEQYRPAHQTFSCAECNGGGPHSDFEFTNSAGGAYGSTYYGMMHIPSYCSKFDIIVDGSASSCENSYWLTLQAIDPSTWTLLGSPILTWVGFSGEVPSDIILADYLPPMFNFNPSTTYILTLTVGIDGGGPFHADHKLFTVNPAYCKSYSGEIVESSAKDASMRIYPNPTREILNIQFDLGSGVLGEFVIYDLLGSKVRSVQLIDDHQVESLNISDLGQGTYIYSYLIDGTQKGTGKIIIQ